MNMAFPCMGRASLLAIRPVIASSPCQYRLLISTFSKGYATQNSLGSLPATSSSSRRKPVTVTNDDGRIQWGDLSMKEKAARTTQQTINLGVVVAGIIMTGGVAYFLYTEVFASDSTTRHFNRAVDQLRSDPRATALLGPGKHIEAFSQQGSTRGRMSLNTIASTVQKDKDGTHHLKMHFDVKGPLNSGVVYLHLIQRPGNFEHKYKYLTLDVKGHSRLYLENADTIEEKKRSGVKMFGVNWR